jgi:hypothetical protein
MTTIPHALESALAKRKERVEKATNDRIHSNRIVLGDLRIVHGLSHVAPDSRLGLVIAVDGEDEFTEILLVHTAPELACDTDVVVPKTQAAAPYNIVVQTDLRAVVWTWQLGGAVGWVDGTVLRSLKSLAGGGVSDIPIRARDVTSTELATGPHLAEPSDPRWSFKQSEGEALRQLAEDCTTALLDRDLVWQVAPDLLRPELLDRADASLDVLTELLHWAKTRTLTVSDRALVELDNDGALSIDAWNSLEDLATDVWTSLQDVILGASTGVTRGNVGPARHLVTASHLPRSDVAEYDHVHVIGAWEDIGS